MPRGPGPVDGGLHQVGQESVRASTCCTYTPDHVTPCASNRAAPSERKNDLGCAWLSRPLFGLLSRSRPQIKGQLLLHIAVLQLKRVLCARACMPYRWLSPLAAGLLPAQHVINFTAVRLADRAADHKRWNLFGHRSHVFVPASRSNGNSRSREENG